MRAVAFAIVCERNVTYEWEVFLGRRMRTVINLREKIQMSYYMMSEEDIRDVRKNTKIDLSD